MPLCLKDAVFYVRSEIGEYNQSNWSDYQIVADLNTFARKMCSIAGSLTKFQKITLSYVAPGTTTAVGLQEAALDVEVDKVKSCKYFSGQLYDLEYHDWQSLQVGASTGSIPRWYYLKTSTRQLTPQLSATSDIQAIDIGPNMPFGDVYRTVIGAWPIPPNPATLEVFYSYVHDYMQDPTDVCEIPHRFLEGWANGAIARCLQIEKAFDEADRARNIYNAACEEYRIYASAQRQANSPARYGVDSSPWKQDASSSVIIVNPFPTGI